MLPPHRHEDKLPSRILREEILTSERVNALSTEAELFYRRLMSVVDDFGRIEANPRILLAKCYPLQLDRYSPSHVSQMLAECCHVTDNRPLLTAYEVNGKNYIQVNDFGQRERASKYPAPPIRGQMTALDGELRQNAAYARASTTNTTTPPNVESSEKTTTPEVSPGERALIDRFDELQRSFPSPTHVDAAARWWISMVTKGEITQANIGEVFAGLERWKNSKQWAVKGMRHAMDTWLGYARNGTPGSRMWLDHPEQATESELEDAAFRKGA